MARNRALNEQMRDDRKQKILSTALKLFSTKGPAVTKIADIARAGKMAQGLVYHYYPSKEAIYVELVKDAFKRLNGACRTLAEMDLPPEGKIKLAVEGLLQNLTDSPDSPFYHLLISQATASEATPAKAKAIIKTQSPVPYKILSRIIKEGQDNGTIIKYPPDDMAVVFWTTIKGLALNKALNGKNYKLPDPAIVLNMFFKGGR